MLEPKTISVKLPGGGERNYIISKFPAVAGREIIAQYPVSAMPKLGDYKVNEEIMLKLMAFVAVETDAGPLPLQTRTLVDNHIPDWETLGRLEIAMMEYNCSFFANGKISALLDGLKAESKGWISSILTDSLGRLLQTEKQRSENSKTTTL